MALSEFELIRQYFHDLGSPEYGLRQHIALSVGDDCALLTIPAGQQLALSIDTLNAGVHFPADAAAADIGSRALAVAVSDLAAMGAKPLAFTLALSLPAANEDWLQGFAGGLRRAADNYGIALIGGDTTRGPLSIALQVHGLLPAGRALKRGGAEVGDCIFVTGSLGDAAAALELVLGEGVGGDSRPSAEDTEYFLGRFYRPEPRLAIGESLQQVATAAIDISDGLLADLGHILEASAVGAELYSAALPLSAALQRYCDLPRARQLALSGGDDYELCFTAAPEKRQQIAEFSELLDLPITEIGRVVMAKGLRCLDSGGREIEFSRSGYQHF